MDNGSDAGDHDQSVVDPVFGDITLRWRHTDDDVTLTASGDHVPIARLVRSGAQPSRTDVPIGTRDPERLRLFVDDVECDIVPSPGQLSRRSYGVRVEGLGNTRLFTPSSSTGHRLVSGSKYGGRSEIGVFTTTDNHIGVEWSDELRMAGLVSTVVEPAPFDSALGILLAGAFGTGARFFVVNVVVGVLQSIFPQ